MLKNYFKIAIAVLKRRKFFTFISLFGISFTLTILMVMTAFVDKVATDDYPDRKRDRSLYIANMEEHGTKSGASSSSTPSFYFFDHYVRTLKTPEEMTIFSRPWTTNTYLDTRKVGIHYKYTDAAYWSVLDYVFREGRGYTRQQVENGEAVAVISEDLKREYFGEEASVVGKFVEIEDIKYKVSGVVKSLPPTSYLLYADAYIPYTTAKADPLRSKSLLGDYMGIILANSRGEVANMKREFDAMASRLKSDERDYDVINTHADPYIEAYVRTGDEKKSGKLIAITAIAVFVLLVMLLPTVNLININVTRIMERSSEIGVRKAFGASSKTLVYQFVIENLILTGLGGLIGVVLSWIVLGILNRAALIPNLELSLNGMVLLYSLMACMVFGLLSGVYPAWRMSRMNVVTALKAS